MEYTGLFDSSTDVGKENLFESIPQEILETLLFYLDIPSIGILAQTSKNEHGTIAQLASGEKTWLRLVNQRFQLFSPSRRMMKRGTYNITESTRMSKPRLYGGSTWKEAYRSMARCNRIPKMKVNFKRKSIFAKGSGYITNNPSTIQLDPSTNNPAHLEDHLANAHIADCSIEMSGHKRKCGHYSEQCLACWIMINHTEDCTLRSSLHDISLSFPYQQFGQSIPGTTSVDRVNRNVTGESQRSSGNINSSSISNNVTRFIELQLAFQNTKSGFCNVNVEVCKSTILMRDNAGNYVTQRIISHGMLRPKIVYRGDIVNVHNVGVFSANSSGGRSKRKMKSKSNQPCTYYFDGDDEVLTLKPFEFAIVSVCVPMTHYMERGETVHFETDFLSRSLSVCVPAHVWCDTVERRRMLESVNSSCPFERPEKSLTTNAYHSTVAVATFADEHEIWDHYMELPGGFLTLLDKRD